VRRRLASGEVRAYRYDRISRQRLYERPGTDLAQREREIIAGNAGPPPTRAQREVYFVRATVSGLIKIGVSESARRRFNDLRTASPELLELLGVIVCEERGLLEKRLHAQFEAARAHGEWFRPVPELLDYIRENVRD
jgi:hypothetical protein